MGRCFLFLVVLMSAFTKVSAQYTIGAYGGSGGNIATYGETVSGITSANYITFTIQNVPGGTNFQPGWTLKVRANGNFVNGLNTVSSQFVSLRFRSVEAGPGGVSGNAVPLSMTDANLITTANAWTAPNDYYLAQKFDLTIQGGTHLLVPVAGTYSTTLTVSLYNHLGVLVSSSNNISISFNINYSSSCSGVILAGSGGNAYNFDTYAKLQAGGTVTNAISVQYNPNTANCAGWTLKVRANGNFTNGSSVISPQYVSLRFNRVSQGVPGAAAIGVGSAVVPLSFSDANLITQSSAPFQTFTFTEHKFDMLIQGGTHLQMVTASGTYTCPLVFSLYNQNGQLVSTVNINASFQISYNNSFNYTVSFVNPDVSLQFSSPAAFTSGVSVTKTNGLKIIGYTPYQVIMKTTNANLTDGLKTIPVSVVNLQTTPPAGKPGITAFTRSLSASDQVIITNGMTDYTYQTTDYTLRYYTNGNNNTINTAAAGTYATQIVYIVLPL